MFGTVPRGPALAWSWADQRLDSERNYWVASVDRSGRPHTRPYWGVWTGDTFLFSTASRALENIRANPQASVHLESGKDVVVVEGEARVVVARGDLQEFVTAYNAKYSWGLTVRGELVGDDEGASGNVIGVQAAVVYGWQEDLETATRWTFGVTP